MRRQGRILIVDDEKQWRKELIETLEHGGFHVDSASRASEALERLSEISYHVIVLDIRMAQTDRSNIEGIDLLEKLYKLGLNEATKVIMLSAYGTKEHMRTSFRNYKVVDFLSKEDFDNQVFLENVRQVFAEKVDINLSLDILWQEVSGPEQVLLNLEMNGISDTHEPAFQSYLAVELEDLLCRLFYQAESILVHPMPTGYSSTGMLWVQPFYATGSGRPVVVQFGTVRKIEEEYRNFNQYVQPYLGGGRNTTILSLRRTLSLGGIMYSLLGTSNDQLEEFGSFYLHADISKIRDVLDLLFLDTCGAWYASPGHLQSLNLTEVYQRLFEYSPKRLEQVLSEQLKTVRGKHKLYFRNLKSGRTFTNPLLATIGLTLVRSTYQCTTHGDLNQHNILIDSAGHPWLIDFQKTSRSHILRDIAMLDSVVRLQMIAAEEATLEERLLMEEVLCNIERYSQIEQLPLSLPIENKALAKTYATVIHLRSLARRLVAQNPSDDMSEYYIALLYNALNTVGLSSLPLIQREHSLLCASLIADKLIVGEKGEALHDRYINELRSEINDRPLGNYKHYEEALAAYETATRLDPQNAVAYYHKSVILKNLRQYEAALEVYKQAICLNPDLEIADLDTTESPRNLLIRLQSVQRFLMEAGFEFDSTSDRIAFIAVAKTSIWRERFPKGLYVRILFDNPLDQNTVQTIFHEAKAYTDYALVIVNQPPKISGWWAMGGLRAEENDRFVLLPIEESLIKEGVALKKERQTLSVYVEKHLGKDFNPYDVRVPVSDAVSFFGRESLTDEILNALKLGQSLGLFGLQRMGKSSVLKKLQRISEFPAAYVYLLKRDKLDRIYKAILADWAINTRIKYPDLKWSVPSFVRKHDSKMVFNVAAKELLSLLSNVTDNPTLAIFLDEIENIVPYKDGDEVSLQLYMNLMDSLRGLQQETNSLSLLVVGVHPIVARRNYFWGHQKNPMYQVISERFLPPLDRGDCIHMILSLGQQINLAYTDESLEYIVQMSGAHPFLARQICSHAYRNRGNTDTFSIEYIQKVTQDFLSDPEAISYFDGGLWAELGKKDIWEEDVSFANYRILSSLAASSAGLARSEICPDLNKQTTNRALTGLKKYGIISSSNEDDFYYITFGLFRDWIRLHKLGME